MAKVLAISNSYPPHHLGGYELVCRDVLQRMTARGHDVTVLTADDRRPGAVEPPGEREGATGDGIRVLRDLRWWWDDHVLTNPWPGARLWQEHTSQRALRRMLHEMRPDVVSVWNMGAMSMGLVTTVAERGIPLIFNVCDDWLVYGRRLDAWGRTFDRSPRRIALGRLVRGVTGLPTTPPSAPWPGTYLFVSDATRQASIRALASDLPASAVVWSGIDHHDFPLPTGPVEERPWSWRLLYAGRVEPRKGIETLLRALSHLPAETRLEASGPMDPAYLPTVRKIIDECGVHDRVRFENRSRAELRSAYAAADVFVFPSEWEEPFGLVPIEAMACDTPVVATGTGGSSEFLFDHMNCLLFPRRDPVALAAAIRRLAEDAVLRRRLVERARLTAAWASVDDLAEVDIAWHEHVVDGSTGDPPTRRPPPTFQS